MKKMLKSSLSLVLAFILIFSVVGCNDNFEVEIEQPKVEVEYTNYDLVLDSKSDYKLVLPETATKNELYAANEFNTFFFEATGVQLAVVTENDVTYSAESKLIILGDTKFSSNSGVDFDAISEQSFTVKTVDSNLFICGYDSGVLYGVYDFLHYNLGFESYASDEIALLHNVKNLKLAKLNVSDAPDILYRRESNGDVASSSIVKNRMRINGDIWIQDKGNFIHNTFGEFFPKSQYENKLDKWYSVDGGQLCYTARGDQTELLAMQNKALDRMKELINMFFKEGDFRRAISFTQEDESTMCDCDSCKAKKAIYGTDAAAVIHFINPVAKQLKAWLAEEWPGHQIDLVIFAYQGTELAPVNKVGDTYQAIDSSVVLEDNVAIFYAPFYADYLRDFNSTNNATYLETLKKWNVISSKLYLWTYNTSFINYLGWFDSFNIMTVNYKMAKEFNTVYFFDQGRYNTSALTGFDYLKSYLNAKMAWNVDADINTLIDNFFINYYKDASDSMRAYFEDFRAWFEYLKSGPNQIPGRLNSYIYTEDNFPKQVLDKWMGYINQAYKDIEPLKKSDPQKYQKLYDRICKESIAIRYEQIQLHGSDFPAETLVQMKLDFIKDANRYGYTKMQEFTTLQDTVYSNWGVL